jgi:hypothetical protein
MTKKSHSVTVHVVAYRKAAGLHIQLAVAPELLDLTELPDGEVVVQWKLDTKGYTFPTDGSAIVFTSPGAKKAFGPVKVDRSGTLATAVAKNVDGLAYAYNVSVTEVSSKLTAVLDPLIQNRAK